ncbi:LysR family transcriptional regulator [Ramlibacter sp.]|uniref:LysR family transcriptional regulator n=1 Tax=Ramlibacter sp. TaxID=1917967 RepID=UPI003D144BD4
MRLNLYSLQLFVAVVEAGSIAAAAEREFIAASALSKRIAELERVLGTPLLLRQARGVEPSAAGRVLVKGARTLLHQAVDLEVKVRDFATGESGHVRIAANLSSITQFLATDLRAFTQAHPRIQIDLEERISSIVTRMVLDNVADIGVFTFSEDEPQLDVHPYREDEVVMVMHKSHPLAHRGQVSFIDTLEYEHIGMQRDSAMATVMQRVAIAAGVEHRMRFFVHSYDALISMVRQRLGIGLLPLGAVPLYEQSELATVRLSDSWARRRIKIGVRRAETLSAAGRMLLDHLLSSSRVR